MQQKICSKCGNLKTLDCFSKRKQLRDGYRSQCKSCDKVHNDIYKLENKQLISEQRKCYRVKNKALIAASNKQRKARKLNNQYEKINPEFFWNTQLGFCQLCFKKINRGIKFPDLYSGVLDHIIPLSKGGGHLYSNMQLAHNICNMKKGSKLIERGHYA